MPTVVGTDPGAVKRVTCRSCASRLEYTESEAQERRHRDYTGDLDVWRVVVCPKCGADVQLSR
jgi:RNase P subunit RPR2